MQLPPGTLHWIAFGFANGNEAFTNSGSQSGPWIRVNNDGSIILYGGAGTNNPNPVPDAWLNNGTPVTFSLTYNAFKKTATVATVINGATNVILDSLPVTTSLSAVTARHLAFQFSATAGILSNRWAGPVTVNWIPRPPPLLTLPVPTNSITVRMVGSPTLANDDTAMIQAALTYAASHSPAEVQFDAGATYVITNSATNAFIPLTLARATNVVVNGNGCKIIIRNPRIGFLHLQSCSNVIVEGITVDYDPLPYTQGVVTRNLYTDPLRRPKSTFKFRLDEGYPAPTNANYMDTNAQAHAERWGMIMNTNYPGRGADDRHTIYIYTNVVGTTEPGVFMVSIPNSTSIQTIKAGDFWCMVSRWNGSSVYSAENCYQITFLNLTDYAGAAANFQASATPLVNEINCHVAIGPPPSGATRSRIKSSNADGGYFGNTRIGPWVENCVFTGLSDDVANAYTEPFVITNTLSHATNRFLLWQYNIDKPGGLPTAATDDEFRVGDQLSFFNALTGAIFDRAVITNVTLPFVSVDHPVSGIQKGTYETNTLVFNNSLNTSAVYLNNQFSNSRIHGIYCRADNMLIAHNSVSGMGLSAISGFPALDLSSPNSFVPTNVVIMDNVLSDCSYSYESIHNTIPGEEPAFALLELHQTRYNSDYVSNTFGIQGIRILNNAFLNWRRAPLSLHNVSDVHVLGNYFGPPITNDGLVPLTNDIIADLWSCDYTSLQLKDNVNAAGIANGSTITEDGHFVVMTNAFRPLTAPLLNVSRQSTNTIVTWPSIAPAFILQQNSSLTGGNWIDLTNEPLINGSSNTVMPFLNPGVPQIFYRAVQR